MDATATVRARTGEGVVLSAVGDRTGSGLMRDGPLVVCRDHCPDTYMDRNYVPPDAAPRDSGPAVPPSPTHA
jgi:hypothetical protein